MTMSDKPQGRPAQPEGSLRQYRDELRSTLAARHDLGPDLDDTLAASFLDRIDRAVEAKVEARLASERPRPRSVGRKLIQAGVITASTTVSIPLIAIGINESHSAAGLLVVALVWALTVLVDLVVILKD